MASKEPVLVTGGAGYVGSHVVLALCEAGYPVVVLDDLSTGRRAAVPEGVPFVEGDVGDVTGAAIAEHRIAAVAHFAASVGVHESVRHPLEFYRNNSCASAALIGACVAGGVRRFVFASSSAVYGVPRALPVSEDAPTRPITPYGRSKLVTEWMLRDTAAAHDFRYVVLRCFNVAGADPLGRAGRSVGDATHLIDAACAAALGLRDHVTVFGSDYGTGDGTCVRDYIHVSDLADIYGAALRDLEKGGGCRVLNCGYGRGVSVREVLESVRAVSGVSFDVREGVRRAGDPPALVADVSRIRETLRWSPRYDDLEFIVRTALSRERDLASGRADPRIG